MSRVKHTEIMVPKGVPAGMNPLVVMSLLHMFKATNEDAPDIVLRRKGGYYEIVDGRHRFLASVMSGRRSINATIQEKP